MHRHGGAGARRRRAARRENPKAERVQRHRSRTSSCAPARAAAIRSSSSPARGEWIEIELRHTDWFKRAHRRRQGRLGPSRASSRPRSPKPASRRRFRDILLDDYLSRQAPARRRLGPVQVGADAQGLDQLPALGDAEHRGHARPGAGRLLRHRLLARQPAGRAVVATSGCRRSSASASAASRTSRTRAWSAPTPPTPISPTPRSACAITSPTASCCAPTTRSTPLSSTTRSTDEYRRLDAPASPSSSRPLGRSHARNTNPTDCSSPCRCRRDRAAGARAVDARRQPSRANEQVVVPQVDRRDVRMPRYPSNDFEIGALHRHLRDRELRHQLGLRRAPRLPHHRGLLRPGRVRADQGQRRGLPPDPAGRHVRQPKTQKLNYYNLSVGYNILPGEVFLSSSRRHGRRSST